MASTASAASAESPSQCPSAYTDSLIDRAATQAQPHTRIRSNGNHTEVAYSSSSSRAHLTFGSPMIRWLRLDQDSVSYMLRKLELNNIAFLHSSCKSWKKFIEHPPQHMIPCKSDPWELYVDVNRSGSDLVSRCRWMRSFVTTLTGLSAPRRQTSLTGQQFHGLVNTTSTFTRLSTLYLSVDFSILPLSTIPLMFQSLAQSLRYFSLENNKLTRNDDQTMQQLEASNWQALSVCQTVFDAIGSHLHQLTRLAIDSFNRFLINETDNAIKVGYQSVSFNFLRKLTHLTSFKFTPVFCSCSPDQVLAILELKSLKSLACGKWTSVYAAQQYSENQERQQWIDRGVALLHQLPELEEVGELGLVIDSDSVDCIPHVAKIASLTSIQLKSLTMRYDFLQSLLNLKRITYQGEDLIEWELLQLGKPSCSQKIAQSMLTYLPRMKELYLIDSALTCEDICIVLSSRISTLDLARVRLQSIRAFAAAKPTLKALSISDARGWCREQIDWVKQMPTMIHLDLLAIVNPLVPRSG